MAQVHKHFKRQNGDFQAFFLASEVNKYSMLLFGDVKPKK